jgi:hypothetical protein
MRMARVRGGARPLQRDTTLIQLPHCTPAACSPARPARQAIGPLAQSCRAPHPDVDGCKARRLQRRARQRDGRVGPGAALARRRRGAARRAGGGRGRRQRGPHAPARAVQRDPVQRQRARQRGVTVCGARRSRAQPCCHARTPAVRNPALAPRPVCKQGADGSGAAGWRAGRGAGSNSARAVF